MVEVRPPRGFRDFTPDVMILRKKVIERIEDIFQRYGFDPIETPVIEYWDVLRGKYGEEAESKLVWRFNDPFSGREYAFRYDLTVPLARYLATHRNTLLPFKRYHIGRVWRHERPQKSRYREFYQCDVDIVGSPYPEADAEILNITIDVLDSFGFRDYVIRVNDRRLLRGIFEVELGIREVYPVYITIDKLDKIGKEEVLKRLSSMLDRGRVKCIEEVLAMRGEPYKVLEMVSERFGGIEVVKEAVRYLEEMLDYVKDVSKIMLDLSMVRGLEYYTGPIYETVVEKPRIGSLAGGGRYDELIGLFLGRKVPATGTTIGVDRLVDAGVELGLFRLDKKTVTQVYVIVLHEDVRRVGWRIANSLREHGFRVAVDVARLKIDKLRKYVRNLGVPILVYLGRREVEKSTATIYVRDTGERIEVKQEELVQTLQKLIEKKNP